MNNQKANSSKNFYKSTVRSITEPNSTKNKSNKSIKNHKNNEISEKFYKSNFDCQIKSAKLQDLCFEDKKKIGELIETLAIEKEKNKNLKKELKTKEIIFKEDLQKLQREKFEIQKESQNIKYKFEYSLKLLQNQYDVNFRLKHFNLFQIK